MKDQRTFADCLHQYMNDYMLTNEPKPRGEIEVCFAYITKAYAYGVVQPSTDLLAKLEACRKDNKDLRKDIAICSANYSALQIEHNRLVKMIDQNQNPTSECDEKP